MKKNKFLMIYSLIVVIILIFILFIIPEEAFLRDKEGYKELIKNTEKEKYQSLDIQKKRLLKNEYEYEYKALHNNKQYICTGTKNKEIENGRCTSPSPISYTEKDKFDKDKLFEIKFVEPEEIFKRIDNKEYKLSILNEEKVYTYQTKISNFETIITIYTGKENISRIDITNGVMTYILKFKNVKY